MTQGIVVKPKKIREITKSWYQEIFLDGYGEVFHGRLELVIVAGKLDKIYEHPVHKERG